MSDGATEAASQRVGNVASVSENRRLAGLAIAQLKWFDLPVAALGAAGAMWTAYTHPSLLSAIEPAALTVVGIVIGAVIAGVAIISSFLDTSFLRKLKLIHARPKQYLMPFVLTARLGIISLLALLFEMGIPDHAPRWLSLLVAGIAGFFIIYTVASLLPVLIGLLEFVDLKATAAEVDDSLVDAAHALERKSEPTRRRASSE